MRLAKFIISVLVIVLFTDLLFGLGSRYYVKNKTLPGDYQPIDYLIKESREDIIILGSSVVLNSLMPTVVEDSLGMTCFNGGANSQNLVFFRTMLDCVLKRHTPKMIILGLRPNELAASGLGRYNLLAPYYHSGFDIIDSCMASKNHYEKYLLASNLYRYNTIWFRILLYHFITPDTRGEKGFIAKSKPLFPVQMTTTKCSDEVTESKLNDFNYIINTCKERNIDLVVYFPPTYTQYEGQSASVTKIKEICNKNGVPCFYDAEDHMFLQHKDYFFDNIHLSKEGALVYSQTLAHHLNSLQ